MIELTVNPENPTGMWGTDEFELTVTKALVSLYEKKHRTHRKINKTLRVTDKEISFLKQFGLYFPPDDRMVMIDNIDIKNDGLPNVAGWACSSKQHREPMTGFRNDPTNMDGYLTMFWVRMLPLKKKYIRTGPGTPYAVYWAYAREEGGCIWVRDFVTIDRSTGEIYHTVRQQQAIDMIDHKHHIINHEPEFKDGIAKTCASASAIVGFYQDRVHLWNVTALENTKRATFGVHEAQIQSLFYSRDLPQTKTGRKSPILHWVSAHRRRLKSGIDIDVEKHLRGTNIFEMNGTTFEITRPMKGKNYNGL